MLSLDPGRCVASAPSAPMPRKFGCGMLVPRKRIATCLFLLFIAVSTIVIYTTANARLERESQMEEALADMQTHLEFIESLYRGRQEDVINLQNHLSTEGPSEASNDSLQLQDGATEIVATSITYEIFALLKTMPGTRAAAGIHTKNLQQLRIPFVYQLLPHLMNNAFSLKPAYHMKSSRSFSEYIIGIPTVKRDKESYLLLTLTYLFSGITEEEAKSILIVIMVGETDLEFVIKTAFLIETRYPKHVEQGLIEVISPAASYYPNLETVPDTLGDSHKRVKWRTKQNLDTVYLMAYAQSKGTFYLMLEDDVIAKGNYLRDIRMFTISTTIKTPDWFFIEFCNTGGIGKLFRSADLIHFITYVQLFYKNMPIDWLLESYLADKVCPIDKATKPCGDAKLKIRPRYKTSLFQHIGIYSSLKGKIQKVKDPKLLPPVPTFFPHKNPPIRLAKTDIEENGDHTLLKAYKGETFFWGIKPKIGNYLEIWFQRPTNIERFVFRSGNIDHMNDRLLNTDVEALPLSTAAEQNYTKIGTFDEFGLAEGDVKLGSIVAIRLRVNKASAHWVILSEIELKEAPRPVDS